MIQTSSMASRLRSSFIIFVSDRQEIEMSYPPCECGDNAWSHGTQTGYPREGEPCHAAVFDADGQITDQECGCPGYHAQ